MELRVLGAHNMESDRTHFAAYLVDGVLALDAGSLTRTLTFEEQKRIRAVILSHRHFDHTRDLLPLGLNIRDTGVTVEVYAIKDTVDYVGAKLLDGTIYPVSPVQPIAENPSIRLNVVEFYEEFKVLDYTAMAVPVPHAVSAVRTELATLASRLGIDLTVTRAGVTADL